MYLIKNKKLSNLFLFPVLIFIISAGVALLVNLGKLNLNQLLISLSYLVRWAGYASIFTLVLSFDKSFKELIRNLLISIGATVVLAGFVQFFLYPSLGNLYYLGWDEHLYRMFSVFLDPNFAGAFFALYSLFLLNEIFNNYKNKNKIIILSILLAMSVMAGLLTYSRSAFFMLLTGVIIFLIIKKKIEYIGLLVIVSMALIFILPNSFKTEGTNFLRTASSEARIGSFYQTMSVFEKNSVLGVGFNAYRYAKNRYGFTFGNWEKSHSDAGADNSFAFVLVTTGIVGFSFFVFMWYKILNSSRRSALIISSVIALFVNSMFINSLFYSFIMFWIWITLGLRENK